MIKYEYKKLYYIFILKYIIILLFNFNIYSQDYFINNSIKDDDIFAHISYSKSFNNSNTIQGQDGLIYEYNGDTDNLKEYSYNNGHLSPFLNTVYFVNDISSAYGIHPFLVIAIAWQESRFKPLTININKLNIKLYSTSKSASNKILDLLNTFNDVIPKIETYINAIKFNIYVYTNKGLYTSFSNYLYFKDKEYLNKNQIDNVKYTLNKIKNIKSIKISTNYPIPMVFKNKEDAVYYTGKFLDYTNNIDIGMTQVNYYYWLKKYNIDYALLFDVANAVSVTSQILKLLKDEGHNEYKMIKYYHSRNDTYGVPYANNILPVLDILTDSYNKEINSYISNNKIVSNSKMSTN